jgi:hypothetical protein
MGGRVNNLALPPELRQSLFRCSGTGLQHGGDQVHTFLGCGHHGRDMALMTQTLHQRPGLVSPLLGSRSLMIVGLDFLRGLFIAGEWAGPCNLTSFG